MSVRTSSFRSYLRIRVTSELLILHWQYDAICDLRRDGLISEFVLIVLTGALDEHFSVAGCLEEKRKTIRTLGITIQWP